MANYKVLATWDISIQNLYKDITLIQQGISCKLNISLRSISRVTVNYKVGNEYVTDLCTIDLDSNKVIVPFKKNVLEVGANKLELVCHMKNGDVLISPTYIYDVIKSLDNTNDITEEDAYPVLIGMIQELTKNEAIIQANEEARANAEMYRELNEDGRQNAEAERKRNENTRISNEDIRQSNESSRQQYETQRRAEEDERLTDEQVRVNAENIRIANENERLRKEIERQNAEELRQIAYNSSLYGRMDEVEEQLEHNTSRIEGFVNAKEFGMSEDNEDNSSIFQQLVDSASTIIIPKGTYRFKSGVTIGNRIQLEGNDSTFIFEGTGTFITINGGSKVFNRFKIKSSLGKNSDTLQVGFDMGDRPSSNRQIRFNFVDVDGFSDAGFLVNNDWHITWKHCTIQNCGAANKENQTGGIVIRGEVVLNSWHGSGHIIEDCYISGCNYGFYDSGCWNVSLYNCIFEYNNYPIYKGLGRYIELNRCWFENNTNPCRGGGYDAIGCRGFSVVEANDFYRTYTGCYEDVIYNRKGNILQRMQDGKITKFTLAAASGIKTAADLNGVEHFVIAPGRMIVGEGGGTQTSGKPAYENSVLRLAGYGGYWTSTVVDTKTPLSVLDLNFTSNGGGAGRGYGGFDFKAATFNGNAITQELTSVFGVNYKGDITPMQLNGISNIGSATASYNDVYCNAIVLKSPNGTLYKVTVDDEGVLKTSKI